MSILPRCHVSVTDSLQTLLWKSMSSCRIMLSFCCLKIMFLALMTGVRALENGINWSCRYLQNRSERCELFHPLPSEHQGLRSSKVMEFRSFPGYRIQNFYHTIYHFTAVRHPTLLSPFHLGLAATAYGFLCSFLCSVPWSQAARQIRRQSCWPACNQKTRNPEGRLLSLAAWTV